MILGFRHKGLRRLYESGDRRRLQAHQVGGIKLILAHLEVASRPAQMDLPGLQLHALKGDLAGFWSVSVSGNWRIIFRFEGGHVCDVDLLDYH